MISGWPQMNQMERGGPARWRGEEWKLNIKSVNLVHLLWANSWGNALGAIECKTEYSDLNEFLITIIICIHYCYIHFYKQPSGFKSWNLGGYLLLIYHPQKRIIKHKAISNLINYSSRPCVALYIRQNCPWNSANRGPPALQFVNRLADERILLFFNDVGEAFPGLFACRRRRRRWINRSQDRTRSRADALFANQSITVEAAGRCGEARGGLGVR